MYYLAELLQKLSIRSADSQQKLLNVIKNPLSDHIPADARKITFSSEGHLVKISSYLKKLVNIQQSVDGSTAAPTKQPLVFFIGAMAHGTDDFEPNTDAISISQYSLSASVACAKLCCAMEDCLNII
jgi:rRNA small subunit pseudouridine methyltransferase Nep1